MTAPDAGAAESGAADADTAAAGTAVAAHATLVAAPGRRSELRTALLRLIEPTRREAGAIEYVLLEARDAPGTFVMREAFASMDAFRTHQRTEHYRAFAAQADELLAEPLVVTFLTPVGD